MKINNQAASIDFLDSLLEVAYDLSASLSPQIRYRRLLRSVCRIVPCDSAALMHYENGVLTPLATIGLAPETMGTHFLVNEQPRIQRIIEAPAALRFRSDDTTSDPFDGLIIGKAHGMDTVHSCMGCALRVGDELIGVLTVDALEPGLFHENDEKIITAFAALAAAAIRTAKMIEALEEFAEHQGQVARQLIDETFRHSESELLGDSPLIRDLKKEIDLVAKSDLTVLITGETGTGKEVVARLIHSESTRSERPLVYVNCAALPGSIAESELFGHVKGAFTGAESKRAGKFELADGGTILLDEIGELPMSIQPKLLRVLQLGEIQRVGADQNLQVDVRVIAATNRDLHEEIKKGKFRVDLFHRLSVFPIHVPPLREREDDVALLAGHFLEKARLKLGSVPSRLSREARLALTKYDWPGNVRELEHVITRAVMRAAGEQNTSTLIIDRKHLGIQEFTSEKDCSDASLIDNYEDLALAEALDSFQRDLVQNVVQNSNGNWSEAARKLKTDRSNLYRLAKRLGLK